MPNLFIDDAIYCAFITRVTAVVVAALVVVAVMFHFNW